MKGDWIKALQAQKLEVKSAHDAMQVKGWLDTGNYALNWAVSGRLLRGYPLGRTGEIFGDPSTGKSFLVARAIAMAQAQGGVALLDDTEGAYNMEHSARLGIQIDTLPVVNSHTVQDHLKVTQGFIKAYRGLKKNGPGLLICDSLAALSTEHELKELDKRDMTKAAELKKFYRVVGADLFDLPVMHLATNHTIAAIGSMFESRTSPGGGGPKFMATFRLDLRATSKIKSPSKEVIGVICRAVVAKNRITSPWKEVRLAIPFDQPISRASGLIPLLTQLGILREQGQFLFLESQKVGRAYKTKDRFLAQDDAGEELLDQYPAILEEADKRIEAGQITKVVSADTAEEAVEEEAEA